MLQTWIVTRHLMYCACFPVPLNAIKTAKKVRIFPVVSIILRVTFINFEILTV